MKTRLAIAALLLSSVGVLAFVLSGQYESGDVYSSYSSLRADRTGTRALYEALERTGADVSRNDLPLDRIRSHDATILLIGISPWIFTKANLTEVEAAAREGSRVVLTLDTSYWLVDAEFGDDSLKKEWHVRMAPTGGEEEKMNLGQRRRRMLNLATNAGSGWQGSGYRLSRAFGKGSVTLIGGSYPFTNEALKESRDLSVVESAVGGSKHIVFDEAHLSGEKSGNVMSLLRQFRLQGAIAVALVCALLFVWRSSAPFPPERPVSAEAEFRLAAASAGEGLLNLLAHHIPADGVVRACVAEWKKDRGRTVRPETVARIENIAAERKHPATQWREIRALLDRKTK